MKARGRVRRGMMWVIGLLSHDDMMIGISTWYIDDYRDEVQVKNASGCKLSRICSERFHHPPLVITVLPGMLD